MDKSYLHREFDRAQSLARWSYIGILVPLLGWVLGGISRSIIRGLPEPKNERLLDRFGHVYRMAGWGIAVSVVTLLLSTGLGIWGFVSEFNRPENRQQETSSTEQPQSNGVVIKDYYNQDMLNACINDTNTWYNENLKGVETIYQEQNLLAAKQQYISECQIKYPVN